LFYRVRVPPLAYAAVAILGRLVLASQVTGPMSLAFSVLIAATVYLAVAWTIDGRDLLRAASLVPQTDDRPTELAYTPAAS
jgi:hypothetical protein